MYMHLCVIYTGDFLYKICIEALAYGIVEDGKPRPPGAGQRLTSEGVCRRILQGSGRRSLLRAGLRLLGQGPPRRGAQSALLRVPS